MEKVVKVRTVAGNLVITIPMLVAEEANLTEGEYVRVKNEDDGVSIEKIEDRTKRRKR